MDIEETKPSAGKKFLKIALATFAVFLLLAGATYILTAMKNAREQAQQSPAPNRELSEAEKLQILTNLASSTPKDTPKEQAEKLRILQELEKKTPRETASSSAEKLRILQSLSNQ